MSAPRVEVFAAEFAELRPPCGIATAGRECQHAAVWVMHTACPECTGTGAALVCGHHQAVLAAGAAITFWGGEHRHAGREFVTRWEWL